MFSQYIGVMLFVFFSSRRRHTIFKCDWSSDVCSSDLDSHGQTPGLACLRLEPDCMYLEGIAGYQAAIRAHWFALISMIGNHGTAQDAAIRSAVGSTPGYVLLTTLGGAPTWIYPPDYPQLQVSASANRQGVAWRLEDHPAALAALRQAVRRQ